MAMSRIHSRKKGRASSKKPIIKQNPSWVSMPKGEIEKSIVKLSKEGKTTSTIGIILRDQYAVPNVKLATGKRVKKILEDNKIKTEIPEDLKNLMKRAVELNNHVLIHKKDFANKRGMHLIESKIRRLAKYYIREGVLPDNWRYSLESAKLLVE